MYFYTSICNDSFLRVLCINLTYCNIQLFGTHYIVIINCRLLQFFKLI